MRALVLATLAALAAAGPAPAATLHVGIPSRAFVPSHLEAVAGDSVAWHNTSAEAHDVSSPGFGARLSPGEDFVQAFPDLGLVAYVCNLHPSMTGVVDVIPVALAGPAQIARGEELVLDGRAPAGTPSVTVERDGAPVAALAPAEDGTFRYAAPAESTGTWRAVTPAGAGPAVAVRVVDRVSVGLRARLGRRFTTLRVSTTPARPGATVLLQLWSRERFRWLRAQTARLDHQGATTLTLDSRVRRRARVVLLDGGGQQLAISPEALTWRLSRRPRPPAASPHGGQRPQHGAAHAPPGA